ncbi:basal body-orientation factor 1 [Acrasis kona]|uniref:Basal body-orientation factor 1 n=1 Tax=Acrasis kona TaxID=1008807 RepID=A0AAW2YMD8_9EUKA
MAKQRIKQASRAKSRNESNQNDDELNSLSEFAMKFEACTKNYEKARTENTNLKNEVKRREAEHRHVIGYLQKDIELKGRSISQLQKQLIDMKQKVEDAAVEKKTHLETVKNTYEEQLKDLLEENTLLERMISELERTKNKKALLQETLNKRQSELISLKAECDREIIKAKLQTAQDIFVIKQEQAAYKVQHEEVVTENAVMLVDEKRRNISQSSIDLSVHLRMVEKQMVNAGAEKLSVQAKNKNHKMEFELSEQAVKEYARQGLYMSRSVRDLTKDKKKLEDNLSTVVNDHVQKYSLLLENNNISLQGRTVMVENLKDSLSIRNNELNELKKLSRRILNHKQEMESFFIEGIKQVKNEKSLHKEFETSEAFIQTPRKNTELAASSLLYNRSMQLMNERNFTFSSLNWEEKESVMRILLSRINGTSENKYSTQHYDKDFGLTQSIMVNNLGQASPPRVIHSTIKNHKAQQRYKHMVSNSLRAVPPVTPQTGRRPRSRSSSTGISRASSAGSSYRYNLGSRMTQVTTAPNNILRLLAEEGEFT